MLNTKEIFWDNSGQSVLATHCLLLRVLQPKQDLISSIKTPVTFHLGSYCWMRKYEEGIQAGWKQILVHKLSFNNILWQQPSKFTQKQISQFPCLMQFAWSKYFIHDAKMFYTGLYEHFIIIIVIIIIIIIIVIIIIIIYIYK